jgi:asparagine synthase (glutamine-hydrolysing)
MCGVAGILNYQGGISTDTVNRMLTRIRHRGPDESGIYCNQHLVMGSVRLSIIDISSGQQPLSDFTGRYWIVFNGELFNYIELKEELVKKGYQFRTKSDTEVIVQLYACYGEAALSKMNGQFVFAIWDKKEKTLFIARDRVGIRPLFYHFKSGVFAFGSEIKALFENTNIPRELNSKSLSQVFTFWTAISPNTVFSDIYELQPGHCMKIDAKGVKISKFWELTFDYQKKFNSIDEAAEEFEVLFTDAVKIRLRADVEVAAYLSGGIDSSVTTAYIKKIEPNVLHTFSIGFQENEFDETKYQIEASRYLDTDHKSISCNSRDIANDFPQVIWHSESPMMRTAPVPMFQLSRFVHENNIKVVITGEGADEILGGYDIFKENIIRNFWSKHPGSKYRPLLLRKLYPYIPQIQNATPMMLKMFYGFKLDDTQNPFYSHLLRWNNASHIRKHFSTSITNELKGYDPVSEVERILPERFNTWGSLEKAQWLESTIFMSGYLLSSQGDRVGMANSIEGRYPFLDYRVIEFCASLPPDFKLRGLTEKYLLKKAIKGKIPESIINRSKQAYRAPISSTFLNKDAPDYVKELLSEKMINDIGIFNPASVVPLIEKMRKSANTSEVDNMLITLLVSSHLVHDQFIKKNHEPLTPEMMLKSKIIYDN